MTTRIVCALTAAAVLMTSPGTAAAKDQPDDRGVSSGGQYYELNLRGLRDYMRKLEDDEPRVYAEMQPHYQWLRNRTIVGWSLSAGLSATGLLVTLGGMRAQPDNLDPWLYGGLSIALVGAASAFLIPRRRHYLEFVNRHNGLDPDRPLSVGLAPAISRRSIGATLRMSF